MELKQIKELMMSMARTGTKKLKISREGFELELEQQDRSQPVSFSSLESNEEISWRADEAMRRGSTFTKPAELPVSHSVPPAKIDGVANDTASQFITSPMVGTFYGSPSPEDPPFVKVGDEIDKNTIVCIIEAMKVMNEIKAGMKGTVVEVLSQSGHPVEFGTKLYRIQPS